MLRILSKFFMVVTILSFVSLWVGLIQLIRQYGFSIMLCDVPLNCILVARITNWAFFTNVAALLLWISFAVAHECSTNKSGSIATGTTD